MIGLPVLAAVIVVFGGSSLLSTVPVAKKLSDPGVCTVTMGSVINGQQRLLVSGAQLAPNSNYVAAETGVQSTGVTTDASGWFSTQALVYLGAGKYTITVDYYYWRNNSLVQGTAATCSASL